LLELLVVKKEVRAAGGSPEQLWFCLSSSLFLVLILLFWSGSRSAGWSVFFLTGSDDGCSM